MADKTNIEWTDSTWNPVTGCDKVSEGCKNCYALTLAERFRGVEGNYFEKGFDIVLRPDKLEQPLRWSKPKMIFVNSMSDLFHEDIPEDYLEKILDVMVEAHWHIFQVLTKRPQAMREKMEAYYAKKGIPLDNPIPNVWLGVTTENHRNYIERVPVLIRTPAKVRFLSCEPLIGSMGDMLHPVSLYGTLPSPLPYLLSQIDWVIVGGESGHHARPVEEEWIRAIKKQCEMVNVPFFFKQWGGTNKKVAGRELDGKLYSEMPNAYEDFMTFKAEYEKEEKAKKTAKKIKK